MPLPPLGAVGADSLSAPCAPGRRWGWGSVRPSILAPLVQQSSSSQSHQLWGSLHHPTVWLMCILPEIKTL